MTTLSFNLLRFKVILDNAFEPHAIHQQIPLSVSETYSQPTLPHQVCSWCPGPAYCGLQLGLMQSFHHPSAGKPGNPCFYHLLCTCSQDSLFSHHCLRMSLFCSEPPSGSSSLPSKVFTMGLKATMLGPELTPSPASAPSSAAQSPSPAHTFLWSLAPSLLGCASSALPAPPSVPGLSL